MAAQKGFAPLTDLPNTYHLNGIYDLYELSEPVPVSNYEKAMAMLTNSMIFGIGAILAASSFIAPVFLKSSKRSTRFMLVVAFYVAVGSSVAVFHGVKSGLAEVMLGLIFAGVAELLLINVGLLRTAHYPKNRRCY